MLYCPKCKDGFRKQERLDKHVKSCKGKVCDVCGQIGHLRCGIQTESGDDILNRIRNQKGPITIVGLF
jgi:hypothetical protein